MQTHCRSGSAIHSTAIGKWNVRRDQVMHNMFKAGTKRCFEESSECFSWLTLYGKNRNCQGNATVIQYRISGEGHVWPHVSFNKPGGTAVSSLSASALIWSFFQ